MPGFRKSPLVTTAWFLWVGDPDDNHAHQVILAWLQKTTDYFLNEATNLSNRTKGNLGEFITYCVGRNYVHPSSVEAYGANTWDPLSNISRPGVDIKWLNLGPTSASDWIVIQEVKTTGENDLSLADGLISDYDKLFGQDLKLTLRTRLAHLKNKLDQQARSHIAPRLTALGGPSPDQARGVYLTPTLIHDSSLNSSTKMASVREAIIGQGWTAQAVECWSVQLNNLNDRLTRMSRGQ